MGIEDLLSMIVKSAEYCPKHTSLHDLLTN